MKFKLIAKLLLATMAVLPATQAMSETRVTYKSAKSTSSYYQMAVQIAEGMKAGSNGDITVTVEESQGSVVTTRVGLKETVSRRMPNNGPIQTAMATATTSTDSTVTSS